MRFRKPQVVGSNPTPSASSDTYIAYGESIVKPDTSRLTQLALRHEVALGNAREHSRGVFQER